MSLYPCSACGERSPGKLAQIYWAWNQADGGRVSYKQRLCTTCYCMHVLPIALEATENVVACPVCHEGTLDDMDPVYATIYLPRQDRNDAEMALCARDAVEVRTRAMRGAERLTDREVGSGGPSPQPVTAADVWAALGIRPNGRGPEHADA